MIEPNNSWGLIKSNAIKALKVNLVWHSLMEDKAYKLLQISSDRIIIKREDRHKDDFLTKTEIENAIKKFNDHNCKIRRGTLISPTVAKETALVYFHPYLTWDDNGTNIIEL